MRALSTTVTSDGKYLYELSGSSNETKPTDNVAGGSTCIETDTADAYFFNEKTGTWVKAG